MNEITVAVLSIAACVFAASAVAKLRSRRAYRSFRTALGDTRLVPEQWLAGVASMLCGAEAVTATGLLAAAVLVPAGAPGARPAAETFLTAACLLTAVLAAGVGAVIRRGTKARCACFGAAAGRPLGGIHLLRNVILLVLLAAGLLSGAFGHGHPAPSGAVVGGAAGILVALLLIRWEDLVDLFAPVRGSI